MKRSCCLDPLFYYTCSKRVFCTQQVCVIAPPAHVHLHDGAFLLIEAAGGTMHCIWPSRFLRCRHGGAFPFVSAFHFSLSLCAVESKRCLLRAKSTAFLGEQSKHGREEKLRTRARWGVAEESGTWFGGFFFFFFNCFSSVDFQTHERKSHADFKESPNPRCYSLYLTVDELISQGVRRALLRALNFFRSVSLQAVRLNTHTHTY